jgi:hypothetical protein
MTKRTSVIALGLLVACGGGGGAGAGAPAGGGGATGGDPAATYAALDVGADWASYTKVNKSSFESPTHGNRWVDVWVNQVGLAAYQSEEPFPVGTIVVKTSWEAEGGAKTDVAGPIFVMHKREAGFAPEHEDWWYGLHWETVPASWVARMGGKEQVYWRSPSSKVDYCWGCHENYDRNMGLPPAEQRAWAAAE